MPYSRPTLQTIIDRVDAGMATHLPGYTAGVRRTVENVFARVFAGVSHSLHGHLLYLSQQIFPDTADSEFLDRHAATYGLTRIEGARATGNITVTGVESTVSPAGTVWAKATGETYTQDVDATITSGTATVAVTASALGTASNTATAGETLSVVTPVAGIASEATFSGTASGGVNAETDALLLSRLLLRLQSPPRGGATADYVAWSREVAGVTRAFAFPLQNGPGTVGVTFVRDGDASLIPDTAEVATVQAYLDARKPATATVTVYAPTEVPVSFDISISPNTAAVRDAVNAELADLFREKSAPNSTIFLSQVSEAISVATGETAHTINSPTTDIVATQTEIATFNATNVTYSAL